MDLIISIYLFFKGILAYLFDNNGLVIVNYYILCLSIDAFIGTCRSIKNSHFKSRTYLQGIFLKIIGLTSIPVTNGLDTAYFLTFHHPMIFDISDLIATLLLLYEVFSILENLYAMGSLPKPIMKILEKSLDQTNFKDIYPKNDNNNKKHKD